MPDKFTDLKEQLRSTHITVTIEEDGKLHRVLVAKDFTVGRLIQSLAERLVPNYREGRKDGSGGYSLLADEQSLPRLDKVIQHAQRGVLHFRRSGAVSTSAVQTKTPAIILTEPDTQTHFPIYNLPAVIGRMKHDDPQTHQLAVDLGTFEQGRSVSGIHAQIIEQNGLYLIENLTSQNYVYVEEVRVEPDEPCKLTDGSKIRLGKITLRVELSAKVAH